MRIKIFVSMVAVGLLLAGCTQTPQYMGAAVDRDQNVLTGGPITGVTIQDLPSAVKDTLKQRVPHSEIVSITKSSRNGEAVYDISFVEADNTPEIYVADDGKVMPEPMRAQR